jgi:hypothetical protein
MKMTFLCLVVHLNTINYVASPRPTLSTIAGYRRFGTSVPTLDTVKKTPSSYLEGMRRTH